MSTSRQRKVRAMGQAVEPEAAKTREARTESTEPSAAELADALFLTTHALKYTGRQSLEGSDATLRPLSFPQARVMMVMEDAGRRHVRMGELSAALGVTARNVTTIVDGLERDGLIARIPDPKDRRAILLELTSKGQEHIAEVHAMHCEVAERFFEPLDIAERMELLRLLNKILAAGRAPGVETVCKR